MPTTGPYSQDILTSIINVNWGGLAVEFTERPSYLVLNQALSMNKVTISFWFRIPFEVANARAMADESRFPWDFSVLQSCIPLLMFGLQQSGTVYEWGSVKIGEIPNYILVGGVPVYRPIPVYGTQVVGNHVAPMQPSGIGVQFGKDNPEGGLSVHIQTADMATAENLATEAIGIELIGGGPSYTYVTRDASHTVAASPEALGNVGNINLGVSGGNTAPPILADKWHHILISWDLQADNRTHGSDSGATTAANTDTYSLMWCAIDDVDKNKYDLPANWIGGGDHENLEADPNGHLTNVAYKVAGLGGAGDQRFNVAFTSIPSNPLVVPAPATLNYATGPNGETELLNANQLVEMAELQIFTGIALDTSKKANRRAFLDFDRDEKGDPIKDENGKYTLRPVNPANAEKLMGKRPEVLLHGSSNWIEGYNTGSTGVFIDPTGNPVKIPAGQFVPTGIITRYPDPSLLVDHNS